MWLSAEHMCCSPGSSDVTEVMFWFSLLETEETCPMCSERVISHNLVKVRDAHKILHPDDDGDE